MAEVEVPFVTTGETTEVLFSRDEGLVIESTMRGVYLHHEKDGSTLDTIYLSYDRMQRLVNALELQLDRIDLANRLSPDRD